MVVTLPPMILCGIVRNSGPPLATTLSVFNAIFDSMDDYHAVIVTNDNTDNTNAVLDRWRSLDRRHEVIRVDGLAAAFPDRIDRIAAARNFYVQRISRCDTSKFPLVLVADLDGPNMELKPAILAEALNTAPSNWTGLFANQQTAYYDVFALRHHIWCPRDPWAEVYACVEAQAAFGFKIKALERRRRIQATARFIHDRQFAIPKTHAPILVDSAFGGLGVYRKDALAGCWYAGRESNGERVCEHVILHRQLRNRGNHLYISPSLVNLTPPEHLGPTSGRPFPY